MPYKDPEKAKEYCRQFRIKKYDKEKEKIKSQTYHKNNPHKMKIRNWKHRGIKLKDNEDWDSIYLFYITCENCELCDRKLTDGNPTTSTTRCLDHDHETGFIRNIICHKCNILRDVYEQI